MRGLLLFLLVCQLQAASSEALRDGLTNPKAIVDRIESAVRHYVVTYASMELTITTGTRADLIRGKLAQVEVYVKRAKIKKMTVDEGYFLIENPEIDLTTLYGEGKLRVKKVSRAQFKIRILESDMNQALRDKHMPIEDPSIRFEDDRLSFRAKFRTLFIKSLVETGGGFRIHDGTKIHFVPDRLKLNSVPLPGFVRNTLTHKINPILDLEQFDLIESIREIRIQSGLVEIEG